LTKKIKEYGELKKGALQDNTIKTHKAYLRQIFKKMNLAEDEQPTIKDVKNWLRRVKSEYKNSTLQQKAAALKSYWKVTGLDKYSNLEKVLEGALASVSTREMDRGFLKEQTIHRVIEKANKPFDLFFAYAIYTHED